MKQSAIEAAWRKNEGGLEPKPASFLRFTATVAPFVCSLRFTDCTPRSEVESRCGVSSYPDPLWAVTEMLKLKWVRDRYGKPRGTPLKVSLPFPCPTLPLSGVSLRWAPLYCACLFITDCRDDNEHCSDAIKEYRSESYDYCKDTDESIQEYVKAHCRLSCGFCE